MKRIRKNPYSSTKECADENGVLQRYANPLYMAFEQGREACEKEAQDRLDNVMLVQGDYLEKAYKLKMGEILDSLISENRRLSVELQKDRIERPTDYEGHKVLRSKKKSIQFAISIVKKHLGGE